MKPLERFKMNKLNTKVIILLMFFFFLRKLSKYQSFSSNLGDQNLVNKFNKQEIIRKAENAVRAEK